MRRSLMLLLALLLAAGALSGQDAAEGTKIVTFRFVLGKDMFYVPWAGNGAELERLCALVDEYRTEITAGRLPVRVDSYCASLSTAKENLHTAFVRANRVKSELITRKGLKEADFITGNHAQAYDGNKDMVVVALRIPAKAQPQPAQPEPEPTPLPETPVPEPVAETRPQPAPEPVEQIAPAPAKPAKPYCFAARTNILYDALLLPTLGVEWRISRNWGVKLDGSRSWWGDEKGKVQKIWLLNPEVRWYLLRDRRFYVGASGNYGEYNLYKYALGGIVSKDSGYQGSLWGAGLSVGYQLPLARNFVVDFNLGLGYTRFEYDKFGIVDGTRVYKSRDCSKNFWGPTQAGVSLVWLIGGKR